jgi:hypothetical protein
MAAQIRATAQPDIAVLAIITLLVYTARHVVVLKECWNKMLLFDESYYEI